MSIISKHELLGKVFSAAIDSRSRNLPNRSNWPNVQNLFRLLIASSRLKAIKVLEIFLHIKLDLPQSARLSIFFKWKISSVAPP